MSNIFSDIVNDYQYKISHGIHEVYYKNDLIEGLKLLITFVGIGKIALCVGGVAASAIGSILGYAANHPQMAARCIQTISRNKDEFIDLFNSMGKRINEGYNSLNENQKKYVRTLVLFIAKNGIHWDNLH